MENGGTGLFPTSRNEVSSSAELSRSLQAWLWVMLIAPFTPWYTFPIPIAVFVLGGLVTFPTALLSGPAQPAASLVAYGVASVLGVLWIITDFLAFISARRREWQRALWFALTNLGCGVTILATFLTGTGLGPVEPAGYVSPLAFLSLAALPAAYEIAVHWLRELHNRSGPDAERAARSRLLLIGVGYAVVFVTSFAAVAFSVAVAIQRLPVPHFYWEEQAIRESAAFTFVILGATSLAAFLALVRFLLGPRASRPPTA